MWDSPVHLLIAVVIGGALYFLPAIIAWNKRNHTAITVLNLLVGWTVIGWIACLIWALLNDPKPIQVIVNNARTQSVPSGTKFCTKCGAAIAPDNAFCGSCGDRVPVESHE